MKFSGPKKLLGIFAALIVLLVACASLSEQECRTGDWFQIGVEDGRDGYSLNRIEQHAEACGKIGITPNRILWEKGRIEGLKSYCTPSNAYVLGRSGHRINNVCTPQKRTAMEPAYQHGQRYYELKTEIEVLLTRIEEERTRIYLIFETNPEGPSLRELLAASSIGSLERRIRFLQRQQLRYATWPPN